MGGRIGRNQIAKSLFVRRLAVVTAPFAYQVPIALRLAVEIVVSLRAVAIHNLAAKVVVVRIEPVHCDGTGCDHGLLLSTDHLECGNGAGAPLLEGAGHFPRTHLG